MLNYRYNISAVSESKTARTRYECGEQRAKYLADFGIKTAIELCVGPSLKSLEFIYKKFGIELTGNDIDLRWKRYYENGKWVIGDALKLNYFKYDAVIFAPPLSKGCSGKREDSLSVLDVRPNYFDFLNKIKIEKYKGIAILVLPARSWSSRWDREQYYKLVNKASINKLITVKPLCDSKKIRKYIDLCLINFTGEN